MLHINYYILHKFHPRASIRNRWGSCASFILSTLHFYWLMDIFFKIRFWPYKIEASNALTYLLVSLFISVWYSLCSISRCAWATNRACKYRETKNSISVWLKAVPRLKCRECIFVRGIANLKNRSCLWAYDFCKVNIFLFLGEFPTVIITDRWRFWRSKDRYYFGNCIGI